MTANFWRPKSHAPKPAAAISLPAAGASDEGGEATRRVAQEWLDAFMRRNTAELPPLDEEECIVPVRQTP